MKGIKITYWISTVLTAALFIMSSVMYITRAQQVVDGFKTLGYPEYLMNILATAKIIGVIVLLLPKFPKLKEWAYAGFFIDIIGAFWSHTVVQGASHATPVLLPFVLLLVSYITFSRLQNNPETAIAK
jgi:uncharacterized membrane protein YphA (DoxX/SURF4 family)